MLPTPAIIFVNTHHIFVQNTSQKRSQELQVDLYSKICEPAISTHCKIPGKQTFI